MGNEHVHIEVQDLSIHVEELRNSLMDHPAPFLLIAFWSASLKADFVTPGMAHLPNLAVPFWDSCTFIYFETLFTCWVVFCKLHVEVIKVRRDVDTLLQWVVVFIDQHEIWVDFKASVLTQGQANLVVLLRNGIKLRYRSILEQGRPLEFWLIDYNS